MPVSFLAVKGEFSKHLEAPNSTANASHASNLSPTVLSVTTLINLSVLRGLL